MPSFARTRQGQKNQFLFSLGRPVIWVEGDDDVVPVETALDGIPCNVKIAGGRPHCESLIDELLEHDYPYAVVIDGEFDVLSRSRSRHRRAVTLWRHSMENYYCEDWVVLRVCKLLDAGGVKTEELSGEFNRKLSEFEVSTRRLLFADVACSLGDQSRDFFPKSIEAILDESSGCTVGKEKVSARLAKKPRIDRATDERTRTLLHKYETTERVCRLLRGHFVFSWLRTWIKSYLKRKKRKITLDDSSLRAHFATVTWRSPIDEEHRRVKARLRRATREVLSIESRRL